MHRIQRIVEPERLLLRWQAFTERRNTKRTHWIVADLFARRDRIDLKYRTTTDDMDQAMALGFTGFPGLSLSQDYHKGVLELIERRLPPRSRADFGDYLEFFCIPRNAQISNFALLGYSCGKLPGDGFTFIHPFDNVDGECEFLMEIAGFRHYIGEESIPFGAKISFEHERDNRYDSDAIQVSINGRKLGNVPRGQLNAFHRWLELRSVGGEFDRVTIGRHGPTAYVFVAVG